MIRSGHPIGADTLIEDRDTSAAPSDGAGGPKIATAAGAVVVLAALVIGMKRLADSSFLTHLATGRLILDHGVPSADPYTFTAFGHSWTVQSWLASWWYALLERWFGLRGVQLFTAGVAALIGWSLWALTRPARTVTARLVLVALPLAVGTGYWSERPLMLGLLGLCLVLLAADDQLDPRWLVPVMWVWVNVHGSFPFALVVLVLLAVGSRLDGGPARAELRGLKWACIGMLLGALNPQGPRLLWFPVQLLSNSQNLVHIQEWKAPSFDVGWQRAFLLQLVVVMCLLVRRPSWRAALPTVVLVPMALTSLRNLTVASMVVMAVSAHAAVGLGPLDSQRRRDSLRVVVAGALLAAVLCVASAFGQPAVAYGAYPLSALDWWAQEHGLDRDTRLLAPDFVGNFLEGAYGGEVPTFVDDRAELFDPSFIDEVVDLNRGSPQALEMLDRMKDRWSLQGVLWYRDRPLGPMLVDAPHWRVVYSDDRWILAVPR